ncbi:MAG TPA: Wzz/FepE/Etk N-terminal domain-containing protein, partial [Verrucomicrobiota bacterium]|nr:Wzz/FepE/Etk N-terminal domain-containing protein [Verrucomicrobiota bacterium]
MQTHERLQHSTGLTLADIYYIIFRHKWKILSFSVLGLAVAAVVYVTSPPMYVSEAKLLIRYVVESSMPSGIAGDPQIKNPDPRGDNIINSEVEVLQSLDLATQVVDIIGAGKILGAGPANTNKYQAAVLLQQNLKVEVPRRSNVLRIVFQNPNGLQEMEVRRGRPHVLSQL